MLPGGVVSGLHFLFDYDQLATAADVVRNGGSVAVVNVEIRDADDQPVATARGVYKTGGQNGESPWEADVERDAVDLDDGQ